MFYQTHHFGPPNYLKRESGVNFSFPPHLHQAFELITVESGSMTVTVDGKPYLIKKGDAVLIFPNRVHSLESNDCKHLLFIFAPELISAFSSAFSSVTPSSCLFKLDNYLFEKLSNLDENSPVHLKKGIMYLICSQFSQTANYEQSEKDKAQLLYKIFDFVENNYDKDCSLSSLSQNLSFNYEYLSRYFKRSIGISFNEFTNRYRVSKACYFLSNTDKTVLEIALLCGYESLRSFNRNFKLITQKTPQDFRFSL